MITYQQEFLSTCLDEAKPLLEDHWEEIALNKDSISLDPDYDKYYEMEKEGKFKVFTVRDEGNLVGYLAVLVDYHLHYKTTLWALTDVIFLKKEYRNLSFGHNLINFCETCLRDDGVGVFMINTKCHKPFDGLLEKMSYGKIEHAYGKRL